MRFSKLSCPILVNTSRTSVCFAPVGGRLCLNYGSTNYGRILAGRNSSVLSRPAPNWRNTSLFLLTTHRHARRPALTIVGIFDRCDPKKEILRVVARMSEATSGLLRRGPAYRTLMRATCCPVSLLFKVKSVVCLSVRRSWPSLIGISRANNADHFGRLLIA